MLRRSAQDAERAIYGRDVTEFDRTVAFSDGVFAVAITILVLGLEVPEITPDTDVWTELVELAPQFASYLISFVVIGGYWIQNHRFVSRLATMSYAYIVWTLGFLLGISLISFGTRFVGANAEAPGAITVYAILIAYVSFMEGIGRHIAYRDGLFREMPGLRKERFDVFSDWIPGMVFLLSIPLAFVIGSNATFVWLATWPAMAVAARFEPDQETEEVAD